MCCVNAAFRSAGAMSIVVVCSPIRPAQVMAAPSPADQRRKVAAGSVLTAADQHQGGQQHREHREHRSDDQEDLQPPRHPCTRYPRRGISDRGIRGGRRRLSLPV